MNILMALFIGFIGVVLSIQAYVHYNSQFGARPTNDMLNRYQKSPNWQGDKFVNLTTTIMNINFKTVPGLIKKQLTNRAARAPKKNIPIIPFNENVFLQNVGQPKYIWYGHSVLLIQIGGKTILIDPMFGPDASPVGPITTKRFSENALEIIDQLPNIDAVLLTHDHYDHLDLKSIKKLQSKVDHYFVALGIARHLEYWGVSEDKITEFDWWQDIDFEELKITFTPSRHFSGRGTTDRAKSLWGGWVIATGEHKVYISGDGGYGEHFKTVGERLGPFDIAFVECGQYNENWHSIHMYPEESLQAAIDVGARTAVPIHWGGFTLALHSWTDPIERFAAEADRKNYKITTPEIGETMHMLPPAEINQWWTKYD